MFLDELDLRYVVDKNGKQVAVLIGIDRLSKFMDEVEDLYLGVQACLELAKADQE